ncbi:MAG: hypothetical protein FWH53_00820 [Leptospirales bacterium]|nr:hypothetical protein [Leptospirales bacterium]
MKAIIGGYQDVKVHVLAKGEYIDGEWQNANFEAAIDERMTPRPVTLTLEKKLPEGTYKAGDMKFYVAGKAAYKSGDLIGYKDIKYRIGDISERDEGNYTMYMTQRIYDQG